MNRPKYKELYYEEKLKTREYKNFIKYVFKVLKKVGVIDYNIINDHLSFNKIFIMDVKPIRREFTLALEWSLNDLLLEKTDEEESDDE